MADAKKTIEPIMPGGASLISATKANELIAVLNSLLLARVTPTANVGTIFQSPTGIVLDLSALIGRVTSLESRMSSSTANFISINSSLTSISNNVSILQNNVATIQTQINNATINAVCDANGTLTVNLVWGT